MWRECEILVGWLPQGGLKFTAPEVSHKVCPKMYFPNEDFWLQSNQVLTTFLRYMFDILIFRVIFSKGTLVTI